MSLSLIVGPMFAGKTNELQRLIQQQKTLNTNYIVVKPKIDNRYEANMMVSHNMNKEACITLTHMSEIYEYVDSQKITRIFIDEGQFFSDLKEVVIDLVEKYKNHVVVSGLDGDFNRNKFGQILDLIPFCDTITKLSALCLNCNDGTHAIFSHRIIKTDEQIMIGEKDIYKSVCRKHYNELQISEDTQALAHNE